MPEFDFHTSIKWLAEVEWECPDCDGTGKERSLRQDREYNKEPCQICYDGQGITGTGHIVPFASLRVECPLLAQEKKVWPLHENEFIELHACIVCDSRRWVPEPDVEKACWKIAKVRANAVRSESEAQHLVDNIAEDSLLLDTEAWVKEQEVTNGRVSVIRGA